MRTHKEKEKTIEAIWKKRDDELAYWINEHLHGLGVKNFSIHEIDRGGGGFTTILFDLDYKSAVLMNTDETAMTADDSYDYMMVETEVVQKIAELFIQAKESEKTAQSLSTQNRHPL